MLWLADCPVSGIVGKPWFAFFMSPLAAVCASSGFLPYSSSVAGAM